MKTFYLISLAKTLTFLLVCNFTLLAQDPTVSLELDDGANSLFAIVQFSNPLCPPPGCQDVTVGFDSWYDAQFFRGGSQGFYWGSLIGSMEIATNTQPQALVLSGTSTITVP